MSVPSDYQQRNETQSSFGQIDFVPPHQHSYITTQSFNSAFYKDPCQEDYVIHRAFNSSNFTYLRKQVPTHIKHGAILNDRLIKAQRNIDNQTIHRHKPLELKAEERQSKINKMKMEQIGQLGYFQTFPYQQSLYDLEHQIKLKQQQDKKMKQAAISNLQFRPVGFDKKGKYENPFTYSQRLEGTTIYKEEYLFPFHLPEDTYDRFHQSQLRSKIIHQSSKLSGDFIPASNQKSLTKITRSKSSQILRQLQQYLKKHLKDIGFFIGMNKRDQIDLLFSDKQCDNNKLQMVMSRLCQNEIISRYMLRRNVFKWGRVGQNGYLEFCVIPPWVKDPEQKLSKK